MRKEVRTYEEAVAYLLDLPRFTGKNTMEDTKAFLRKLGNPDRELEIIHVAGTNGKGSVCAYLRYALESAGYRVCLFTSPHLVDIRERFLIEGKMVSKEQFRQAFLRIYYLLGESVEEGSGNYHPSFFEYLFFMAMVLFADAAPDYCILETGLGGRLDATNSVTSKAVSVITSIGLDHTQQLGNSKEEIAGEKAGILQKGIPCVFMEGEPGTDGVIRRAARNTKSPVFCLKKSHIYDVKKHQKGIDFSLKSEYDGYHRVTICSRASYQIGNAAVALRTLEVLGLCTSQNKALFLEGIRRCIWPGRMEEVEPGIFLDGAHNPDGVEAFLQAVAQEGKTDERSLLFGVVSDKTYREMMDKIWESGLFSEIGLTPLATGRSVSEGELRALAQEYEKRTFPDSEGRRDPVIRVYPSSGQAYEAMKSERKSGQTMYVAGSLYLVGEIKEYLEHD